MLVVDLYGDIEIDILSFNSPKGAVISHDKKVVVSDIAVGALEKGWFYEFYF